MNKYELYNKVLETVNGDEGTFIASARNWIEGADEVNFNNEKADELFSKAKQYDILWRKQAINGRISKRRMVACVKEIAEMNLPNPYDPKEPDIEEVVEIPEVVNEAPKAEETKEKIHVLGVVPEEKKEEEKKTESIFHRKRK